ncbi:MAG TPA: N-6 DNA methylase, partial [Rubrivivax sp.]|nr:N-6 DNA methylase [Rubrivivax sp.]
DDVPLDQVEHDKRFNTYGVPRNKSKPAGAKGKDKAEQKAQETVPNANYLWINLFATSLKPGGRAALVMANSASDARHSEADIRRTLVRNNLIYGMLTLPSNLFYTVTLPATLWFFDKGKADDRVLFIDARNVFTQIDRAHRELSDAQTQNLAIIPRLHKGRRAEFVALVDGYFRSGLQKLQASHATLPALAERLRAVLGEDAAVAPEATAAGLAAVEHLLAQWVQLEPLAKAQQAYFAAHNGTEAVDVRNQAQQALSATYAPFFEQLHSSLKVLDKAIRDGDKRKAEAAKAAGKRGGGNRQSKVIREALQALRDEVKLAESDFGHIGWLQQRFPTAAYEDVTGLCKLATQAEIEEQDWSLNPGRYVGVVIEEDGKTEEEFASGLVEAHDEWLRLNEQAKDLESVLSANVRLVAGEA